MSAPSSLTSAQANGRSSGWPGRGARPGPGGARRPRRRPRTNSHDRVARLRVVLGGGTTTLPHAVRDPFDPPFAERDEEPPDDRADAPPVRVLQHVRRGQDAVPRGFHGGTRTCFTFRVQPRREGGSVPAETTRREIHGDCRGNREPGGARRLRVSSPVTREKIWRDRRHAGGRGPRGRGPRPRRAARVGRRGLRRARPRHAPRPEDAHPPARGVHRRPGARDRPLAGRDDHDGDLRLVRHALVPRQAREEDPRRPDEAAPPAPQQEARDHVPAARGDRGHHAVERAVRAVAQPERAGDDGRQHGGGEAVGGDALRGAPARRAVPRRRPARRRAHRRRGRRRDGRRPGRGGRRQDLASPAASAPDARWARRAGGTSCPAPSSSAARTR